jgi:hypothetical protein
MAYFDTIIFVLKYGDDRQVLDRKHIFLLIADYILLLLEDESDFYDRCFERNRAMSAPNITLNKMTRQYSKMERNYLF